MFLDRVMIFAIGSYALLDAVRRRYMPMQREVYLVLFVLLSVLVLVRLTRVGKVPMSVGWIAGILMVLVGFSIMPVFSSYFDLTYFVGDLTIVMFLVVMIITSRVMPEVFNEPGSQKLLLLLLFAAMLLAPVVQAVAPVNDQIAPPHMFLMAASWAGLVHARERRVRFWLLALLMLELVVAYGSEQRTNVLLWFGFGAMAFLLRSTMRQKLAIGTVVLVLGFVALGPASDTTRQLSVRLSASLIEGTRFSLLQDGPDQSLLGRYLEVQDVWLNMEEDWTPANWLIGAGHGATYRPFYWYPERNMKNGRTHNIHFGPMLVLFRYGIVGVGLLLLFISVVTMDLLRPGTSEEDDWQRWWSLAVNMACVGAVLTFFLSNTLQDPMVAFTIAAFFSSSRNSLTRGPVSAKNTLATV